MSLKTIRVKIKPWKQGLDDAVKIMKDIQAGKKVKPQKGVYFDSMEAVRSLLTDKRIELIGIIRDHEPKSVNELARLTKRDFKLVHQDVNLLREFGIIDAIESKQGVPTQLKTKTTEIQLRIAV